MHYINNQPKFPVRGSHVCLFVGIVSVSSGCNVGSCLLSTVVFRLSREWREHDCFKFQWIYVPLTLSKTLPPPAHPNHNTTWRDSVAWRNVHPRAHSFCRSHRVYWGRRRIALEMRPHPSSTLRPWMGAIGQKVWSLLPSRLRHVLLWSCIF